MKLYTVHTIPSMQKINKRKKRYVAASLFSGCGGSSTGLKLAGFDVRYANEFIPIAAETYKANAPNTFVDTTDIRLVTAKKIAKKCRVAIGELDLLDASPPCFPAGALIRTAEGMTEIEKIKCGDFVLTHMGKFRRVTNTMSREYNGKGIQLSTLGCEPITSTPEHPFLIRRYSKLGKLSKPFWLESKNIMVGDFVCNVLDSRNRLPKYSGYVEHLGFNRITRQFTSHKTINTLPLDSVDFWYIIGRWLGDGWLRYTEDYASKYMAKDIKKRNNRFGFLICCKNAHIDEGVERREIISRLERLGWKYRIKKHRTVTRISITGAKELVLWALQFGRGAENKRLTKDIFDLPIHLAREVVRGYIAADGTPKGKLPTRSWGFCSVSRHLVQGMSLLIAKVSKRPCNKTIVTDARQYIIEGRIVNGLKRYNTVTSIRKSEKKQSLYFYEKKENRIWMKVRKIEEVDINEPVFNISVNKDETYTVNGIAVHNCKSFSRASLYSRKGKRADEVVLYSEGIKQRVDDLFMHFARILKKLQPKTFIAENVPGMLAGDNKGYFVEIHDMLTKCGYVVSASIVNAGELGTPQNRKRLIFVGVRKDLAKAGHKPVFPQRLDQVVTVRDVLPNVKKIKIGGGRGYVASNIPSPTVTATDSTNSETADMSCGGWIETGDGERRKYKISELKKVFAYPADFKLIGNFKQKWERIGRSHAPLSIYYVAATIKEKILDHLK